MVVVCFRFFFLELLIPYGPYGSFYEIMQNVQSHAKCPSVCPWFLFCIFCFTIWNVHQSSIVVFEPGIFSGVKVPRFKWAHMGHFMESRKMLLLLKIVWHYVEIVSISAMVVVPSVCPWLLVPCGPFYEMMLFFVFCFTMWNLCQMSIAVKPFPVSQCLPFVGPTSEWTIWAMINIVIVQINSFLQITCYNVKVFQISTNGTSHCYMVPQNSVVSKK